MKKEKKEPNPTEPDKEPKEVKKDTSPAEAEEKEYVGLPDQDLKKNLGCG